MIIEIWGKPDCIFCTRAKRICESRGLDYTYKQYGEDFTKEEILAEFVGATTFPQIKIDGVPVGGYTEFKDLICR